MSKARWSLFIAALLLAGAGCASTTAPNTPAAVPVTNQPAAVETQGGLVDQQVVRLTEDGFDPKELTVKKGETVMFLNEGTTPHWPASGPHPTHTNYPEFDPKQGVAPGQNWSFTFEKVGVWPFHDHLNPSHFGKVTVTE